MDAWNISLSILTSSNEAASGEVRFFAAQTLKHKVVSDFTQLDEGMVRALKDTLWRLTMEQQLVERQVTPQLYLALAALIVQCSNTIWPCPVEDLVAMAEGNRQLVERVLSVLAYIPEQLSNPLIHLQATQYEVAKRRLIDSNINKVVNVLGNLLLNNSAPREQTLTCLLSWIKYGAASPEIVASDQLLATAFSAVVKDLSEDSPTIETTTELVCELFFRLFQVSETPSPVYMLALAKGLTEMKQFLFNLLSDEDEGAVLKVGRVFIEAGEAFLPWLMNDFTTMGVILESCLGLAEYTSDLKVVESTFSFWSTLEVRLSEAAEPIKEPFVPIYQRLFRSLIVSHLSFPLDESRWTAEERDSFRDFRHVIGDCLKDCTRVMGSTEALMIVFELLRETSAIPDVPWQRAEAILFALRTISSSVDRRESEAMPKIADLLLQLTSHPKLVYGVILNIGCYAEWVCYHNEYLAPFLSFVSSGFREHQAASAMALKYLCQSCDQMLLAHEPTLRSLYSQCLGHVSSRNMQDLTEAIANILAVMPEEQLGNLLPLYINPWIMGLQSNPGGALDNLAIFIELVGVDEKGKGKGNSPTMDGLLAQLIPNLPSILVYSGNNEIMDSLVIMLKSITSNHHQFSVGLVDLLDLMYTQHGVAGALYVLRGIVMSEPPLLPYSRLQATLAKVIPFAESSQIGLMDLLHMIQSCLDYYGELILDPLLIRVIPLAEKILLTDPCSPSDLTASILFYSHLLQRLTSQSYPIPSNIKVIIDPLINSGIGALLQGLIQCHPLTVLSDTSSLLRRHYHYSPDSNLHLFSMLLTSLPESLLVSREKTVWMDRYTVGAKAARARELKETILSFVKVCRRRL